MRIDLVVFDLVGTTLHDDGAVSACLQAVLHDAGIDVSRDELDSVAGLSKPDALKMLLDRRGEPSSPKDLEKLHEAFVQRMVRHYQTASNLREVNGTTRTFARLRAAQVKIAIDTGLERAVARVVLDRLCWEREELVDAVVTSDEVGHGRPRPDMIFLAMERTSVSDSRLVAKVGDTPADLQQGAAAGCGMVIGVTGGTHTRLQLMPHPHTTLIRTVAALPEALGLFDRQRGAGSVA